MAAVPQRLDLTTLQKVGYCIPDWLRDEQVKLALTAVAERIQPATEKHVEPIAIVGFGPSLKATWEKIRDFQYIMTCSGSHRFLIDRGIVPTWHVEVDPRKHKVTLLGEPHPNVIYLPASACHPDYFAHLKKYGAPIQLWHVFSNEEEGIRLLPRGEWAITGGCDVGLRCLTIARFFGFTDQHIFGLDGSAPAGEQRHAGEHPNGYVPKDTVEYNGQEFYTSPGMLEAARLVIHELNQMPDVEATFYGDGLIQEMMKDYKRVPSPHPIIAFNRPELISAGFCELNRQLHRDKLEYGVGGGKHAPTVVKLVESLGKTLGRQISVLDYGCGKGYLAKELPFPIFEYDPAIPGKEESPRPADLVICTDVLEHVEPEKLTLVLDDLRRCVQQVGYFTIHTGPAIKHYADGRNTHLIQKGANWWNKQLSKFFTVGKLIVRAPEIHVVVGPQIPNRKSKASISVVRAEAPQEGT